MKARRAQWAELHVGALIQAPDMTMWLVIEQKKDWTRLKNKQGSTVDVPPRRKDHPVVIVEPSEAEALELAARALGARRWGELEALAAQPARAARNRLDPLPSKDTPSTQRLAKTHVELMHCVYVSDVKDLAGVVECHNLLHSDDNELMGFPHHHAKGK